VIDEATVDPASAVEGADLVVAGDARLGGRRLAGAPGRSADLGSALDPAPR